MPKQPKIRPHYKADALYLLRLAQAVAADESRPRWWRRDVIDQLQSLAWKIQDPPDGQAQKEIPDIIRQIQEEQEAEEAQTEAQVGQETGIREEAESK